MVTVPRRTRRATRSKYGAVRVAATDGGPAYASKREARRHAALLLMERHGVIADLRREVPFELVPAQPGERAVTYRADFVYREDGALVVEDCKGVRTTAYRIKRRLMQHVHGITVRES